MANIDSKTLETLSQNLYKSLEVQESVLTQQAKEYSNTLNKTLEKSNLQDKKLQRMLQESHNADGSYKKKIEKLTSEYIKEQKFSKDENKKIQEYLKEINKSSEKQSELAKITQDLNRRAELNNPLNAIAHGFEDLKKSGLKQGLKTTGSGLLESAKQQLTFKNMSKSLLHGAGLLTDSPALNILASSIESDIKKRDEELTKTHDFIKELNSINGSISSTESSFKDALDKDSDDLSSQKELLESYKSTGNIEELLSSMYQDHGEVLENILEQNKNSNILMKKFLYTQRDLADDKVSTGPTSIKDNLGIVEDTKVEEEKGGVLDNFNLENKKMTSKLTSILGKGAAIAAAGMAGFAIGDWLNEQMGQRTASSLIEERGFGGALKDAGEGLLITLGLGSNDKTKSKQMEPTDKRKQAIFGDTVKDTSGFFDDMESNGVVNSSTFGKDKVNLNKFGELTPNQMTALMNEGDWSTEDYLKMSDIYRKSMLEKSSNYDKLNTVNANTVSNKTLQENQNNLGTNNIPDDIPKSTQRTSSTSKQGTNTVIPVTQSPALVDKYSIEDDNLLTTLQMRGIRQ